MWSFLEKVKKLTMCFKEGEWKGGLAFTKFLSSFHIPMHAVEVIFLMSQII